MNFIAMSPWSQMVLHAWSSGTPRVRHPATFRRGPGIPSPVPACEAPRHRLQCGRDAARDPALPAVAARRARGVRLHLRPRRGDSVDGAGRPRAGHALAGPLRGGGGAAAHPGPAAPQRDPRLVLRPGVGGREAPRRGARHRRRWARAGLPRRRAREGERSPRRARGGDPPEERGGAHPRRRQAPARLPRPRVAAVRGHPRTARPPRLRLLVEHDGPSLAVPASAAGGRALVEIPVSWVLDDAPYFMFTGQRAMQAPGPVLQGWLTELDGITEVGGVTNFTFHPQIIGRPSRFACLRELIEYAR